MNAIELLEEDHQMAMSLIDELETADDDMSTDPTQTETFNKLNEALKMHMQMEEQIFYPALENMDETRELIKDSYEDHEKVDQLLMQLSSQAPKEEEFQEALAELRSSIEQHVEEEEGELFPKAEEVLGQSKLEQMGRQMMKMRDKNTNTKEIAATMRRR